MIKFIRRSTIMARKRFQYFKFNLDYKRERGALYDMEHDLKSLINNHRSINMLDFSK